MLRSLGFFLFLIPLLVTGQVQKPNRPQGFFHLDSVKIGQPVNFTFYLRHAPSHEVIFPDSAYNFAPFEFVSRAYFPTKTLNGLSLDSVVYTLRTFSIEPSQTLSLPAYYLTATDTLPLYSSPETVFLKQLVKVELSPENLKTETTLAEIKERFNYAYWFIGAGVAILLGVFIWLLFGKQLIIRYRLYILRNDHSQFINKYNAFIEVFNKSESMQAIEQAITLWKNYLTRLEGNAINSFTTKEIAAYYNEDEDVSTALRLFDKAIYGNIVSDKSSETIIAFYLLHHFADRRYEYIKDITRNVPTTESVPQLA